MAIDSKWIDIVNNTTDAELLNVDTWNDLYEGLEKMNIRSMTKGSYQYWRGPIVKTVGKASTNSGSTATQGSATVNVRMRATPLSGNKLGVQLFVACSEDADGNAVKSGVVSIPDYAVAAAVAAVCGVSIGYEIANNFCTWLRDNETQFDWGASSVTDSSGRVSVFLIAVPSGSTVKYYIEENILTRLIQALNRWGLWDMAPGGYVPDEPVMDEFTNYDFTGRFPDVPDKWVPAFTELINNMVNKWGITDIDLGPNSNFYIACAIFRDGSISINVIDTHEFSMTYRNEKINGMGEFENEEYIYTVNHGGGMYFYKYFRDADGNLKKFDRGFYTPDFTLTLGPDGSTETFGEVYDNFGNYRPMYAKTSGFHPEIGLGSSTSELNNIVIDPDAVDLRTASLSVIMPDWWADRIIVSTPDVYAPYRAYPVDYELNDTEEYLMIRIPERAIDSTSTQNNSITGNSSDDLINNSINDTPSKLPYIGIDPGGVIPTNPPSDTPVVPTLPDGANTSGLVHLYSLTSGSGGQAEAFRGWLWSLDASLWKAIMQNPMDAIIGFHAIFATPDIIGQTDKIVLGNLTTPSGTGATLIKQYKHLSCGRLGFAPYFQNINDIVATKIQLFLPFIGFVDIDSADIFYGNSFGNIVGRYLYVDYYIDFMTGACTACISTKEELSDENNFLYQFTGNCAIQIPITGADYTNVLRNVAMMAGGGAVGVVGGMSQGISGALSGGLQGIEDAIPSSGISSQTQVQRSGSVGSNNGAMGIKRPYVVITRTKSYDVSNRRKYEGLPENAEVKLGAMSGYTRVKYINLEGFSCTEEEKADILAKLKGGVFI